MHTPFTQTLGLQSIFSHPVSTQRPSAAHALPAAQARQLHLGTQAPPSHTAPGQLTPAQGSTQRPSRGALPIVATLTATRLLEACRVAEQWLARNREAVNAINVSAPQQSQSNRERSTKDEDSHLYPL